MTILAGWAPLGIFAVTCVGLFMKVSAFMTRTELLLKGQDRRIRKLEKKSRRAKQATKEAIQ